ncbi:MAG: hypothetical protein ABT940_14545, partial [Alphaproteobacteria bacterium]
RPGASGQHAAHHGFTARTSLLLTDEQTTLFFKKNQVSAMQKPFPLDHPPGLRETFSSDRPFIWLVILCGSLWFWFVSLGYPPGPGTELPGYLHSYYHADAASRLSSPIGSTLLLGLAFKLDYMDFQWLALALYLMFLLAVYATSRILGVIEARIVTLLVLLHVEVNMLFHDMGGDNLLALALALWCAMMVGFYKIPSMVTSISMGVATFGLILMHPFAMLFAVSGLQPLVSHGFTRHNTLLAGVSFTPALNWDQSFTIATSVTDGDRVLGERLGGVQVGGGRRVVDRRHGDALAAAQVGGGRGVV